MEKCLHKKNRPKKIQANPGKNTYKQFICINCPHENGWRMAYNCEGIQILSTSIIYIWLQTKVIHCLSCQKLRESLAHAASQLASYTAGWIKRPPPTVQSIAAYNKLRQISCCQTNFCLFSLGLPDQILVIVCFLLLLLAQEGQGIQQKKTQVQNTEPPESSAYFPVRWPLQHKRCKPAYLYSKIVVNFI